MELWDFFNVLVMFDCSIMEIYTGCRWGCDVFLLFLPDFGANSLLFASFYLFFLDQSFRFWLASCFSVSVLQNSQLDYGEKNIL